MISQNGLKDLLVEEIGEEETLYDVVHFQGPRLEFAFTHTGTYGESYFSFVNGQFTVDGGTHQTAFRLGVLKAIDDYAGTTFSAEDVREGMIGAVAIKVKDPVFESQTKHKLGNNEIRGWVADEVKRETLVWLHQQRGRGEEAGREDPGQRAHPQGTGHDQEAGPRDGPQGRAAHPQADRLQGALRRREGQRAARNPRSSSPRATRPAGP